MAAKTHAERQAEYRDKQQVRARHFGHLNDLRQKALLESGAGGILDDKSPEAAAIVRMFMALPLCHRLPHSVDLGIDPNKNCEPCFLVYFAYEHNRFEQAAARLAIKEISSIPVYVTLNDKKRDPDPERTLDYVKHEVQQLRDAGVWWTEYPGTNIYDKRDA